jgi:hypothetical protein
VPFSLSKHFHQHSNEVKGKFMRQSPIKVKSQVEVLFQWFDVLLIRGNQVGVICKIGRFSVLSEKHQGIC